jgi:sugar O-acyltransferase (sialic acid O-acetyltransferase NeuD family)
MLIIGAKGHAKEILDVIGNNQNIMFFDDVSKDLPNLLFDKYKLITSIADALELFKLDNSFILGTGGCKIRRLLFEKFTAIGGMPISAISQTAVIGTYDVVLGKAINIMHLCLISNNVKIGDGTLINARSNIHHDVEIGEFCEISPSSTITGGVKIGDNTFIGSGSVVLPKLTIGIGVTIGAGSIITKNIPDNVLVYGNPGRIIKEI